MSGIVFRVPPIFPIGMKPLVNVAGTCGASLSFGNVFQNEKPASPNKLRNPLNLKPAKIAFFNLAGANYIANLPH